MLPSLPAYRQTWLLVQAPPNNNEYSTLKNYYTGLNTDKIFVKLFIRNQVFLRSSREYKSMIFFKFVRTLIIVLDRALREWNQQIEIQSPEISQIL